ncbi:VOC family protein [Deinococcus hopiensis]|uniref:VOC domain-containing protein n=1 Tax=Deinococcus hopiensis KR-140 TaxID=695939 RepID=A0A1W1UWI9_9DEIO|nr:VOC family protein [Deinococcus hopiensis]SMB85452.1 hypothetical protein SAMN00790413_03407 [Deinococcus hopiensis KR-140]
MKTILAFVTLLTPDYQSARSYFTEVLGFEPTEERPNANAFVNASGAGLAIREDRALNSPVGSGITTYFIVPDVARYYDEVSARGAKIVEPLHDMPFGRTFSVATPDGHQLGFYEA